MPEENQDEQEEKEAKEGGPGREMFRMLQNTGMGDERSMALYLGDKLKEAGVGQGETDQYLDKVMEKMDQIPTDMPQTQMKVDEMTANSMSGNPRKEAMKIVEPMMPYLMAFKMLDMFTGQGQQEQQQSRSSIEQMLLEKTVDEKFGEAQGGDKLDEISGQLGTLNRRFSQGEIGRGTAIEQLSEQAEELQGQMKQFGKAAESMGYSKENKGTLEKITDVSEKINKLLGNLRKSAPSGRGGQSKPERKVTPAGEEPETKTSPEERPGPIPVQKEEEPEEEGAEAEEPEEEPEKQEEPESEGRPRDSEGRFLSKEEMEASEESED